MPEVEVYITDREESINRRVFQYTDLEVVDTLNAARTAKFTGPITDTNAINQSNIQHFKPMERFVKVVYRSRPVFWGPITQPHFNFKENRVEVNCIDPSVWMMNHHIDTREAEDIDEVKVNGVGLEDLLFTTYLTAAEVADGALEFPVTTGEAENYFIAPEANAAARRTHKLENGVAVFDALGEVSEAADGPDWAFIPIDRNYDPYASWSVGFGAAFKAVQTMGTDKSDTVVFHWGFARINLDNFIYSPDGTAIRNRQVVTNGRGVYRVAKYLPGYAKHGIMEGWDTAPGRAPRPAMLRESAKRTVRAYGEPLNTFSIEPTWDQGLMGSAAATPWRYPTGYSVGDYIRAIAKLDRMEVDLVARVTQVTLTQLNQAENVQARVECIPRPVEDLDITVGETIQ